EILEKCNIPVWVMEPLRGGKLANLDESLAKKLDGRNPAAEAFRFIASFPNIKVILSGMSTYSQMVDNVATFENYEPMNKEEADVLLEIAEDLKQGVPCTACRYCVNNCPMGLDIPALLNAYNDIAVNKSAFTPAMYLQALPEDKRPTACVGCGACAMACPQKIDIPKAMSEMADLMPQLPDWDAICKERNLKAREKMLARQKSN
ncbi:MAG: 4Fe-4S dicluster domain-containing protein, partial [Lachnospiraceae bacterium]|nr:4Fe-4S dicluster domain-containing protein [Lachnospiraceae bacterium]